MSLYVKSLGYTAFQKFKPFIKTFIVQVIFIKDLAEHNNNANWILCLGDHQIKKKKKTKTQLKTIC